MVGITYCDQCNIFFFFNIISLISLTHKTIIDIIYIIHQLESITCHLNRCKICGGSALTANTSHPYMASSSCHRQQKRRVKMLLLKLLIILLCFNERPKEAVLIRGKNSIKKNENPSIVNQLFINISICKFYIVKFITLLVFFKIIIPNYCLILVYWLKLLLLVNVKKSEALAKFQIKSIVIIMKPKIIVCLLRRKLLRF